MINQVQHIATIQQWAVTVVNADGTNTKIIATAGASGSRVEHLTLFVDEGSKVFNIVRCNAAGTIIGIIGQFTPTINTVVDVLASIYALPEKQFILLKAGEKLGVALTTGTMTAGKTCWASADGGDY